MIGRSVRRGGVSPPDIPRVPIRTPRMAPETRIPSVSLIRVAQGDASRSVSKWRWTVFGAVLSILPIINIVLLGISTVVMSTLVPKIDLSTPKRLMRYFQNPACYTAEYQRTARRLRCLWTFYGWLAGVIILNLFF